MTNYKLKTLSQFGVLLLLVLLFFLSFLLIKQCRYSSDIKNRTYSIENQVNESDKRDYKQESISGKPFLPRLITWIIIGFILILTAFFLRSSYIEKKLPLRKIRYSNRNKNYHSQQNHTLNQNYTRDNKHADSSRYLDFKQHDILKRLLDDQLLPINKKITEISDNLALLSKQFSEFLNRDIAENENQNIDQDLLVKLWYYPAPDERGFHSHYKSKEPKPGSSIYELEQKKETPEESEFRIIEDPAVMKQAINYCDSTLIKACEIENRLKEHPEKIIMIKPGIVRKELNYWKIIKKAQIRYE